MENASNSDQPNPEFVKSILAGLRYWQQKTERLSPEQVAWLDERRQNLHRAVLFGLNQPETWEDTAQLLLQAFDFSEWRGYWPEWIPVLEQALATAPEKETVIYGRLQNRLGQLYRLGRHYSEAVEQHEEVLQLARALANEELELVTYSALIAAFLKQNKIEYVEKYGQLALAHIQTVQGNERPKAFILKDLAEAARYTGNWPQAVAYLHKAVDSFRVQNDLVYLARCLNDLGVSYLQGEDFARAQHAFEEAGQILQPTINEIDKVRIYLNLGVLFYRQEAWENAEEAFLQIDPIALREQNEFHLLALFYSNLGNVYVKLAQWARAVENLDLAVNMFRTLDNKLDLGNSLGTLATAYGGLGESKMAKLCFEEALSLLRQFPKSDFASWVSKKYSAAYQALLAEENDKNLDKKKKPVSER